MQPTEILVQTHLQDLRREAERAQLAALVPVPGLAARVRRMLGGWFAGPLDIAKAHHPWPRLNGYPFSRSQNR